MIITAISKEKKIDAKPLLKPKEEQLYDMLNLICHICAHPYDSCVRIPIAVCPQDHVYCSPCVSELFAQHPTGIRCPTCRAFVTQQKTKVNKTLLRICDLMPKALEKYCSLQEEKDQLERQVRILSLVIQKNVPMGESKSQDKKQNLVKDTSNKEQFNGFPLIHPHDLNKAKKLNIHSYVSRRRRLSSAHQNKVEDALVLDQPNLRKKLA